MVANSGRRGCHAAPASTRRSGIRIAYIDTTDHLPGMVELIEINDGVRTSFTNMARRAREWDGTTLIATN